MCHIIIIYNLNKLLIEFIKIFKLHSYYKIKLKLYIGKYKYL